MSALAQCRTLLAPNLVVCAGYGDELPVYPRARALWQFYVSHFPGIEVLFVRDSEDLSLGEIRHDGHDLVIGVGKTRNTSEPGYAASGRWSTGENYRQIYRQTVIYDYLLRRRVEPFFIYQSTITSVIDFRGLLTALGTLPSSGCFAGMPAQLSSPDEVRGFTFCCGTNTLLSSDIVQRLRLRQRYDPEDEHNYMPNDIWQGMLLKDTPRRAMPFFSFTKPRVAASNFDDLCWKTQRLVAMGHFHFRVKTNSEAEGLAAREDVDPWVMLKVMQGILSSVHDPAATRQMLLDMARFSDADENGCIPTMLRKPIFHTHERRVALSEADFPE